MHIYTHIYNIYSVEINKWLRFALKNYLVRRSPTATYLVAISACLLWHANISHMNTTQNTKACKFSIFANQDIACSSIICVKEVSFNKTQLEKYIIFQNALITVLWWHMLVEHLILIDAPSRSYPISRCLHTTCYWMSTKAIHNFRTHQMAKLPCVAHRQQESDGIVRFVDLAMHSDGLCNIFWMLNNRLLTWTTAKTLFK